MRPCDVVIVARPETLTAPFPQLIADLSVALDRARPAGPGRKGAARAGGTPQGRKTSRQPAVANGPTNP